MKDLKRSGLLWPAILVAVVFLSACTVKPQMLHEVIEPLDVAEVWVLERNLVLESFPAKKVTLRAGTTWHPVGVIRHGVVHTTSDQIVLVEAFNSSEAYIVVNEGSVVGYFLPVEHAYLPVDPVRISTNNQ